MYPLPKKTTLLLGLFLFVAAFPTGLWAQAGGIVVEEAFTRATGAAKSGAVFLVIANEGSEDDRLVGVSSPVATSVEIRAYVREGGSMRVERLAEVVVPAGGSVEFKLGGPHLMLTGLSSPIEVGKSIPMSLTFARAGTIEAAVEVREMAGAGRELPQPRHRRGGRRGGGY